MTDFGIYFEHQEGALCAQHCLNGLLQGPYFTAVDLAEIAKGLDALEAKALSEGGVGTDYMKHLQQPSSNYDDSGFFSVQVLQKALEVFSLELVPFNSERVRHAKNHPEEQQAYVCNLNEHWFTIRKFGGRHWFNLNSILNEPAVVTDTYLGMYLAQLEQESYTIYTVVGTMATSSADVVLSEVDDPRKSSNSEDADLQAALAASLQEYNQNQSQEATQASTPAVDLDSVRAKRLARFG
eukprot:Colp12_sorted_trinity150504_noHs@9547